MDTVLTEAKNQRVVTFLNREEVDFLDKLGKDALFSTGLKVSRAKLIAWVVDFVKNLGVTGENIKSERDFEVRIMEILEEKSPACHGRLDVPPESSSAGQRVPTGTEGGAR